MKYNRNAKKRSAFTIVELVIVIAVIAILAAVLIPTFSSLITASKRSADAQLAKNINTTLSVAEVNDGRNNTFHDAIADIQEGGYTLEKLTPTAEGCLLAWDQKNDRIVFLDSTLKILYAEKKDFDSSNDLWIVAKTADDLTTYKNYNLYLAGTDAFTAPLTVGHGVDVGNNTGITEINYVNNAEDATAQNVIIRTNGGILTIDAQKDTVKHYGTALTINVDAVAMSSLDEFGKVLGNINLKIGHVKLASTADVGVVQIAPGASNEVKLTGESGATLGTLYINPTTALTSEKMDLNLSGVTCSEIVKGSNAGSPAVAGTTLNIPENPIVLATGFSGGIGTKVSPYIVTDETELGRALAATSGYYLVGLDVNVTSEYTVNEGVHITISEIGSLTVQSDCKLYIAKNSSLTINGDLTVDGSLSIYGKMECNGLINVLSGGLLTFGNDNGPKPNGELDNDAEITIGKSGVCTVTLGKIKCSAKINIEGVLDIRSIEYSENGLFKEYPGYMSIKSTGTLYMLKSFLDYPPQTLTGEGRCMYECEDEAKVIYVGGSNIVTYVYDGANWN